MPRTVSYFQTNTHLFDALNLHKTIFITRTELARGKLLEEIISSFGVGSRIMVYVLIQFKKTRVLLHQGNNNDTQKYKLFCQAIRYRDS